MLQEELSLSLSLLGVHGWDKDIVVELSMLHLGLMDILYAFPTDWSPHIILSYPCPLIADLSLMDVVRRSLYIYSQLAASLGGVSWRGWISEWYLTIRTYCTLSCSRIHCESGRQCAL